MDLVNLFDYEQRARELLTKEAFDYYFHGANDEVTVAENRRAFDRIALRYRVLAGISERDLSAFVLGHQLAVPIIVAPTAFHRLAHTGGEVATAIGAGMAGTGMFLSTLSTTAMEEVVAAATGPVWFQLYIYRDRGLTADLVERAEAAGCAGIALTVDAPILGKREPDIRNRFPLPEDLRIENAVAAGFGGLPPTSEGSGLADYVTSMFDPGISWNDLEWLVGQTTLPVLVKGVVRGDDAVRCVEHGARAVIVSNHGGRQLDTAPATIDALPEVVEAVDGRTEVIIDGGIRRGTDIVKALGRGAAAVLLGRPVLWGLAVGGAPGVRDVFTLLAEELDTAMALCGVSSLAEITDDLL